MRNTSIESAKNSSSFASTESAAKKNISLNGRYSSMEEFVEKLSTEMLFHRYIHAIDWQNTARSSRVIVSVEAQDVYSSCESWNVEICGLDRFTSIEVARAYIMACSLLKARGLNHDCQLRGAAKLWLTSEKADLDKTAQRFTNNLKDNMYYISMLLGLDEDQDNEVINLVYEYICSYRWGQNACVEAVSRVNTIEEKKAVLFAFASLDETVENPTTSEYIKLVYDFMYSRIPEGDFEKFLKERTAFYEDANYLMRYSYSSEVWRDKLWFEYRESECALEDVLKTI